MPGKLDEYSNKSGSMLGNQCGLPESLAATYRKFGHIGKLACRAIRVTKTTERAQVSALPLPSYVNWLAGRTRRFFLTWPNFRVIGSNCSCWRAKSAHFVGHLP